MANLIPIFITLLVCGALFVFFNARLAAVQGAVEKQNRVLTAFITNVQNDIRGGAPPPFCDGTTGSYQLSGAGVCARPEGANVVGANVVGAHVVGANVVGAHVVGANHLASAQALNAAARQFDNGKIVVSEDESDDDSDDDSDESDDDSEVDDGDDDVVNVEVVNVINGVEVVDDGIEVVEIENNNVKLVKLQEADLSLSSPLVEEIIPLSFETLPNEETLPSEEKFSNEETLKVVHLDSSSDSVVVDYEHMKVDELRKLVSDKGLATKEEVKKLKKPELLVLLKN